MPDDSLDPEGRALWRRVTETVQPLKGRKRPRLATGRIGEGETKSKPLPPASIKVGPAPPAKGTGAKQQAVRYADTLDAGWDKRLGRGVVSPDFVIDLHGHTLATAHAHLETGLALALARQARLVLLVTGRPPPPGRSRLDNPMRGIIRASVGDWLDHSHHAGRIAAVRAAHPKHGGAGALYIILRRAR